MVMGIFKIVCGQKLRGRGKEMVMALHFEPVNRIENYLRVGRGSPDRKEWISERASPGLLRGTK